MIPNKIANIVFYIIALIAILILILQPNREKRCMRYQEKIKSDLYFGRVSEKYIDKEQHYSKVLKITKNIDTVIWVVTFDKSGFYDYIDLNDSILKKKGSLSVKIFGNEKPDTTFNLNYGCND